MSARKKRAKKDTRDKFEKWRDTLDLWLARQAQDPDWLRNKLPNRYTPLMRGE